MINENENILDQSVTAIAKSGNKLKAVELKKQGTTIEVIKTKSSSENVINWQDFAVGYGLTLQQTLEEEPENRKHVAVGYDSAGTAFSRVNIPAVEDKELESMVKLQAESRLPLPADQMEIAWRADKEKEGQLAITIAAARRQQVQGFVDKIDAFKPTDILLDCEGIVKAWKEIFSGTSQNAVIINTDTRNTQICLTKKGQLINAVALDMGTEDFAGLDAAQQDGNIERFVQDTRSIVDLFGIDKSEKLSVYILSDGSSIYTELTASLKYAGLNAIMSKPETNKFSSKSKLDEKEIFEYRLQIGLALMVIENTGNELDLFRNIYKPFGPEKQKHWLYNPKIAGAIAAAVLLMYVGVVFGIEIIKPNKMKQVIEEVAPKENISDLVKQQEYLKFVQAQRPDFLNLFTILTKNAASSENESNGNRRGMMNNGRIQLYTFDFKKGKKIAITGIASDHTTLYNFEDNLKKEPLITSVEWSQSTTGRSSTSRTTSSTRATTSSSRNRTASTPGRTSGMSNFGPESVRFTMEIDYGPYTKPVKTTSKQ